MTTDLKTLKEDIRAILISAKNGLSISQLEKDYNRINGYNILYSSYGFTSMIDFLKSISDCVSIKGFGNYVLLFPVVTKETEQLNYMIQKQRDSPKKRHRFNYKALEICTDKSLFELNYSISNAPSKIYNEQEAKLSGDEALFVHYPPNAIKLVDEIVMHCCITQELEPNEGYYPIRVSCIQTPYKLYFQLKNIEFEKVNYELQQYYEGLDDSKFVLHEIDIRKNRVCATKFEGTWYRAEIVSEELDGEGNCKVLCFDYGEIKVVNRKSLKYLMNYFGIISRQAYRARIAYIQPTGTRWSRTSTQILRDLVGSIWLYAKLEYYSCGDNSHYISIFHTYTSRDINVAEYLISNCSDVKSSDVKGKQSIALAIPTFAMYEQGLSTNKELID